MKRLFYVLSLLMVTSKWIVAQQPTTVQTPQGSIVADTYIWPEEISAADVEYINKRVKIEFPRAIVLKPATTTYNCHAYAWHISEGGSAVWMGRYTNPTSIYWTDGSYVEISNPIEGAKVSYANDNHSAVVTNDIDVFISKWGPLPLVKHEKHYCPYESSSLRYFVKFNPVLNGPSQICDATGTFTLSNLPSGATVLWSTSNAKALQIASGQGTARCTVVRGTLSLPGSQRVTATVNYLGASTTLSHTVQVGTPAPSIAGPYEGLHVVNEVRPCQTYTCQVHNTQSGVKRYDWWLYGDDFPTGLSIGNYASFSVSRPGEYTITCKQYQEGCGWSSEARLMVYARGNGCNSWGIKPNPTPGPIELRPYRVGGGEEVSLMRSATPSIVTLRQVHVFSADGRLVLERRFPASTANTQLDLSLLRPGTYHLLINGTEHHVVVRE